MKLPRLLTLAALGLATGCASSPPVAGHPPASYAPGELVLRVRSAGGMIPVSATVTALPEVSVYGDGRVITTVPVPGVYPGPALPNLQERHIGAQDVRALARRALDAGVGNGADLGTPQVADAPSTQFTVRTEAGLLTTDVLALGVDGGELTGTQRAARHRLRELLDDLRDLPRTLGKPAAGEARAYEPAFVAAVAREWRPSSDGLPSDPPAVAWPGGDLPGPAVPGRPGVTCTVAAGPPVLAAARRASSRTPWTSAGARWTVELRPLLPDESSCADLTR